MTAATAPPTTPLVMEETKQQDQALVSMSPKPLQGTEGATAQCSAPAAAPIESDTPGSSQLQQQCLPPPSKKRLSDISGVSPLRTTNVYTTDDDDDAPDSPPPPVGEIRIPTALLLDTTDSSPHPTSPNYEQLYFLAMRRNYRLQQKHACATEENRRLKRHLIELQRRMYTTSRKRTPVASPWTVPPTTKRSRTSVVSTDEV